MADRLSSEDITRLVAEVSTLRPAYQEILPFFERLFTLQEAAAEDTSAIPMEFTPEVLAAKQEGGFPLIDAPAAAIDKTAAGKLFAAVCDSAKGATNEMAGAAVVLAEALATDPDRFDKWVDMLLAPDDTDFNAEAVSIGVPDSVFRFLLSSSIWPSLQKTVRGMQDILPADENWDQGMCPACGSPPALGFISEDNKRHLICRLCRHQWVMRRVCCPYCHNSDPKQLGYFFSESEQEYRVYICDQCHKYIKTIHVQGLTRIFYAPLEDLVTTHLDLQAEQLGYSREGLSLAAC